MSLSPELRRRLYRHRWPLAAAALTAVFLLANAGLLSGREVPLWDAARQFHPFFSLVADAARQGRLVFWDPWTYAGAPLFAEPQAGTLSPLVVLAAFVLGSSGGAYIAWWLFVWWLGGAGMLLLARHWRAPAWGGFVTALGFLFCGFYCGHAEHMPWLLSFSLLPWTAWRFDVACTSRRTWPAVEAGALWGLSACGGYPGLTIATGLLLGLWAVGRWLGRRLRLGRAILLLTVFAGVGAALLAPTYWAFFAGGAGYHERVEVLPHAEALLDNALEPGALATFAAPTLAALKAKQPDRMWASTDVSSVDIFLGAVPTLLLLLAVALRPRRLWSWWLLLLGLLFLGFAVGGHLPLRGWLYDLLPPTRFFRHSALFRTGWLFAGACLALLGAREVARLLRRRPPRRTALIAGVGLSVAAVAVLGWHLLATPWSFRPLLWATIAYAVVVWGGIAASSVALASTSRWRRLLPAALCLLAVGDAVATRRIDARTISYADPASVQRWRQLDAEHSAEFELAAAGAVAPRLPWSGRDRYQCNDQIVTKRPNLGGYTTQANAWLQAIADDPALAAMALGSDRFFFATAVAELPADAATFAAWRRRADAGGAAPLLLHPQDGGGGGSAATLAALPAATRIAVEVGQYRPERLQLELDAPADGWLLVTDRWAADWQAAVDGAAVPVQRADFVFRAVAVPQGRHRVVFTYATARYLWPALASWLLLLGIGLRSLRRLG